MIDQALKYRLVGTAVLLLVAALLLPFLFDGANEKALLAETRMPAPPQVPAAETLLAEPPSLTTLVEAEVEAAHAAAEPEPVDAPVPVAVAPGTPPPPGTPATTVGAPSVSPASVPAGGTQVAAVTVATPTPAQQPAAPAADTRLAGLAEAWDVQVAALSTPEAAEKLRAKLAQAGYKARVAPVGRLFRVSVGPELRREDAESARGNISADARFGKPQARIVRYVP